MNKKFNQNEYIAKYNKENYIRKEIRLRKEENALLQKILIKKNISLKKYLLEKLREDLN